MKKSEPKWLVFFVYHIGDCFLITQHHALLIHAFFAQREKLGIYNQGKDGEVKCV